MEEKYLTVKDLQQILNLSRSTAYALANSGELKVVRIGSVIHIPRTELDKWINAQLGEVISA